jgi:hypothetical protein
MSKQYPGGVVSKTAAVPTSLSASGIWTLDQQLAAQAASSWPFIRDPQFNYVTMLLHADGSAGANNGAGAGATPTVTNFNADASTNNFNVTINGDARSNNFTPYQGNGYYSNYFDGSSYLTAPSNAVFGFGTGDFTVECWAYWTGGGGENTLFCVDATGGANIFLNSSSNWGIGGRAVTVNNNFGTPPTQNTWHHLAVSRSGTTIYAFIDGSLVYSGGNSTNYATGSPAIAAIPTASANIMSGFISNLRVLKGTALYTAAFTPSTAPLTSITNTSLLTCQSNRFVDNSANAFTITLTSSPQVSATQPFTLPSSVATYGSGYFDGTGDYLTLPVNSAFDLGTNACCIESWVYLTSTSAIYMFATSSNVNGQTRPNFYARYDQLQLDYFGNVIIQANVTVPQNAWNHVVFTRASSSGAWRIFLNGVLQAYNATGSQNLLQTGAAQLINSLNGSTTASGYIADLRVVNGSVPSEYVTSSTTTGTQIFTPPTAPLTAVTNTSLLTTQYNGGGNNSGFKDSSLNNFPITRNGNTTQGTLTPYGQNWSNYFNGSTSYLTVPSSSLFKPASSDFTIEAWVFVANTGVQQQVYGDCDSGTNNGICLLAVSSTLRVQVDYFTSSTAVVTKTTTGSIQANVWNHICVSKTGTTMYIGYNGTLETFTSIPSTMQSPATIYPTIARLGAYNGLYVNGYISNLRYVIGSAVYTGSTYTVPISPLTAISGTSLLTCQSNRFIDNSTNALAITLSGAPSIQRFSPFANAIAYNPATLGGSAYFDGSGDYLRAPTGYLPSIGTGSFTIEGWWNFGDFTTRTTYFQRLWSFGTGLANDVTLNVDNSGNLIFRINDSIIASQSSGAMRLNSWNHVALVRSGSTVTIYLNGTSVASASNSSNLTTQSTSPFYIGSESDGAGGYFYGYCAGVRVSNTAIYTAAFTPNTTPLTVTANTQLLLNFTNAGIFDQAMMNDLETQGNAQISTSVVKYGAASMYFDGTGDGLFARSTVDNAFGAGDFTVEFWINLAANLGSFVKIVEMGTSGDCFTIETQSTTNVLTVTNLTSTVYLTSSTALTTGTWIHVAVTRASGTLRIFQNGTQTGSVANTVNFTNTGSVYIGQSNSGQAMNGYLDDLRITKGYARYTSNFTPPTAAFLNG